MNYLKIPNWTKWQSYRSDRGQPPWIKLHRALLRHPHWQLLDDAQKGQLASIWMLAADRDGEVPSDPLIIQKFCMLTNPPDMQLFMDLEFIERDANVTPSRRQRDANVTPQSRVGQSRIDKKADGDKAALVIAGEMADEWNRIFGGTRGSTNSLVKAIKAVLKLEPGTTAKDFVMVVKSRCNEDWAIERKPPIESLIRAENFSGHLERAKEVTGHTSRQSEKFLKMEAIAKKQEAEDAK